MIIAIEDKGLPSSEMERRSNGFTSVVSLSGIVRERCKLTKTEEPEEQQRHDDQIQPVDRSLNTMLRARLGDLILRSLTYLRFARRSSSGVQSRETVIASSSSRGGAKRSTPEVVFWRSAILRVMICYREMG